MAIWAAKRFGGGQAVAVGDEIGDFRPVDLADVEAKADPSSRADVGGAVEPRLIRCQEDLVLAALGPETDRDDAVAVVVIEVICEFLLPNGEGGVVTDVARARPRGGRGRSR